MTSRQPTHKHRHAYILSQIHTLLMQCVLKGCDIQYAHTKTQPCPFLQFQTPSAEIDPVTQLEVWMLILWITLHQTHILYILTWYNCLCRYNQSEWQFSIHFSPKLLFCFHHLTFFADISLFAWKKCFLKKENLILFINLFICTHLQFHTCMHKIAYSAKYLLSRLVLKGGFTALVNELFLKYSISYIFIKSTIH